MRRISINPGSMEESEYGLTRGTRFVARRHKLVAVAGLLWRSWCVLGGMDFSVSFSDLLFFERTRPAAIMRPPCLIYSSNSTWMCTGCCCLIVCPSGCVCVIFVVFTDCEADLYKAGIYEVDVFRRAPSRGDRHRQVAVDIVVCFGCGGIQF